MLDLKKIYEPYLEKTLWNKTEIMIFCPFHSHNHNTPSLSVNTKTGQFHCKACSESGGSITFYAKTRNVSISQALKDLDEFDDDFKERPVQIMPQSAKQPKVVEEHDYSDYILQILNESLLHEARFSFYGQKLYKLRGITYPTAVACCVGYDAKKGWIIPIFRYKDQKCVGYEIREKNFKKFENGNKCYKAKGSQSCLSIVYNGWHKKRAFLMEGYMDSMKMYQYLHENLQKKYPDDILKQQVQDAIITPSCGVKSIEELLIENNLLSEYEEVIFVLDQDKPGKDAIEQIAKLEHGGRFKFYSKIPTDCDFEWYYDNVLKKA